MHVHICAHIVHWVLTKPVNALKEQDVTVTIRSEDSRAPYKYRIAPTDKTWSIMGHDDRLVLTIRVPREEECVQIRNDLIKLGIAFTGVRQLKIALSDNPTGRS